MDIIDIKKNKFWISIGAGLIFLIVFYLCVVGPFRLRKIMEMERLERLLTKLERYENKGHKIRNKKWIKVAGKKREAIKNAQNEYKLFYKEQDRYLERIFASISGERIRDEALWGNKYIRGINILLDKISDRNISLGENALPFKQWKEEIPTWEEIAPEQKNFWIIEELVNILLKEEVKVDYLKGINFEIKNVVSTNAYTELYDVIPFTIQVSMDVESLLFLINELLKSKLPFEIETIRIDGELNKSQSVQKREFRSPSIVDIVIGAYVLDFKI